MKLTTSLREAQIRPGPPGHGRSGQSLLLGLVLLLLGAVVTEADNEDYRPLGYSYLSPVPGAEYTSRQTRFVLVRFQNVSPNAITNLSSFIQVTGSLSGPHSGQTRIAGDRRTVSFQMDSDFIGKELVTVSLAPAVPAASGGPIPSYQYQFVIADHMPDSIAAPASVAVPAVQAESTTVPSIPKKLSPMKRALASTMPNGVSVPSDFPRINITVNNNPDTNFIFIDNRGGGGRPYNVIFDNNGSPVWYMRMPDERRDMKVQANGVLTMLARDSEEVLRFDGLDTHYRLVTNYWAVNGYSVDEHELQVLADGTYFLIGVQTDYVDMSRYVVGGNPAAAVTDHVIQEFTPAGELIFQWRAWDNFDILDQQEFINLLGGSLDFPHINAIDVDTDGHILLSSRSTSEITKINRDTGQIIWRLGGVRNQFTFVNDPLNGFRNQHSIRTVGTNRYILFDNGNLHNPPMSRGVEYAINTTNMTATRVWQYPNPASAGLYSYYMANIQRLPNGNTLLNWSLGGLPKLTEVRPDGTKAFEMNWVDQWETYRTWRCAWRGSAVEPYLILEPYPDNITLIFNQFGDTNVAFYRIYGGTSPNPTNLLAASVSTLKQLNNLQNGARYYFRVTAVNRQGVEGLYSNETNALINLIPPGQNMVANGDFAQGKSSWVWTLSGAATASWAIESGVSHIYITNGTTTFANIQLKQTGKALVQGKKYVFEFDAWSVTPRYIEAKVAQDGSPNQSYSSTAYTFLTPIHNHFRYVFTMNEATDFNASVFFNLGSSPYGVYFDNASLYYTAPGDLNLDGKVDLLDLQSLSKNWLKQGTGLNGDINANGRVDFNDLSILGENWKN